MGETPADEDRLLRTFSRVHPRARPRCHLRRAGTPRPSHTGDFGRRRQGPAPRALSMNDRDIAVRQLPRAITGGAV